MSLDVESPLDPALPQVPEHGRVVEVRGGIWAVTDVTPQRLPRSPADETRPALQHVVALSSLAEDRLGEELAVVWELEVGHTIVPEQGMPEHLEAGDFEDPNRLGAFVDAVRWGAITSADPKQYQAPFRSSVDIQPYQLEPLRRALAAPRTNLLLADDVGLGKTIEAGLVIQELLLRHRARSVVIVCPPSLALKWQDELRDKFGLGFQIVNSATMADVRRTHGLAANPLRLFPRVILSMSWLASPRAQRMLRDVYSDVGQQGRRFAFDLLVVDEAHHVAPASPSSLGGGRGYAVDSQRTIATRALAERCEHRLFLSATPHNGHPESFTALLEMIDDRRFSRGADLDEAALNQVTVRRLKSDLPDLNFPARSIKAIPFEADPDVERAFAQLSDIFARTAKQRGKSWQAELVKLLLTKRLLSSPWAFGQTLSLYEHAGPGQPIDDDADYYCEVLGSQATDEEEGLVEQPEFGAVRRTKTTDPLAAASSAELSNLTAWALGYQHHADARARALLNWLDGICRPAGSWSNERVVIFTEYADTLTWITGLLEQHGYQDVLATIQGSTDPDERELVRARFSTDPAQEDLRVLIATDAAGEGIDLQTYCHRLVNLDVPFNPSRLEQRIGRIDRYGQQHAPQIYYLAAEQGSGALAADHEFLRRIAEKVSQVARDLGSANEVIDVQIQQRFTPSAANRSTKRAHDGNALINKALAGGRDLNRQLTELADTYPRRRDQLHVRPFNTHRVVREALSLAGQPGLSEVGDESTDAPVYEVPRLSRQWQTAVDGLATRLHPDLLRPITFDETALFTTDDTGRDVRTRRRDDLVYVHLGHALLQKSARTLRGSMFGADARGHRVSAVVVPDLDRSCVAAVSRLVLVGRGGLRLHEEVFFTGLRLGAQGLAEAKVEQLLDSALDSSDLALVPRPVRVALAQQWNADGSRMRSRLQAAVGERADRHRRDVAAQLTDRETADVSRAREIYAQFRRVLTESLTRMELETLDAEGMLFDDQRRQRQRDMESMRRRLDALDDEERREVSALRDRYVDVQPFVSVVAVVFALTAADAASWGS